VRPGGSAGQVGQAIRRPGAQANTLANALRHLLALLLALCALAATRPHYGGTLRVEVRESVETADPPPAPAGFSIAQWEAGHRAVYTADENAPGGRPFLDGIEILMGRPLREQSIDLELGRADLVQLGPNELRRPGVRKTWSSRPIRVVALVFAARVQEAAREALALAVDRAAIHNVLLQRQGEISGALVPHWLSGYAFLFPAAADIARARWLVSQLPTAARSLSLAAEDRDLAGRIALNARDAGLSISLTIMAGNADVRLIELRIGSSDPARALAEVAAALGQPRPQGTHEGAPPHLGQPSPQGVPEGAPPRADSPDALFAAERALLEGYRVAPLFHLPDVYGVGPRVRGGPGITPLGQWQFDNLWLESGRP